MGRIVEDVEKKYVDLARAVDYSLCSSGETSARLRSFFGMCEQAP